MKLVRFGEPGRERPGLWLDNHFGPGRAGILDVRAQAYDLEDFNADFFARGGLARLPALALEARPTILPAQGRRLGPPVATPGKIICVGKNYADHAKEFDAQIPTSPVLFSKAPTAWSGPHDPIVIPREGGRVDAEAELAFVIGRRAKRVAEADAAAHIAGYLALNDVTDRDAQKEGLQWFRGKSSDTFCPAGPWLLTADEAPDPGALRVWSKLNGSPLQEGNTRELMFRIPFLVAFLSRHITLLPGDVISTGTPSGVGFACKPPRLLTAGDTIEVGIDGIGALRNPVVAEE
jgi:2-keto-4-pentenoate hydratase/2-oxohepta-3-ene-1,7-dioic acid hydratase in catechol pathway